MLASQFFNTKTAFCDILHSTVKGLYTCFYCKYIHCTKLTKKWM